MPSFLRRVLPLLLASAATALGAPPANVDDPAVAAARKEFIAGTELVKLANWSEALAAFERSALLRPHAVTTYNVGMCQRAIGFYSLSRATLRRALDENQSAGATQLSQTVVSETRAWVDEIERLLARAIVHLKPEDAAISVDGRPLAVVPGETAILTLVAGVRPPGAGEQPPSGSFTLLLDPGAHLITLSRKGYTDALVKRDFPPGSTSELKLEIDRLPAVLHISSNREGAVVRVSNVDVGLAPVDVQRPAGSYRVAVRQEGFVPYEAEAVVQPGQEFNLRAELAPEKRSLVKRWWFWTAIGAGVAAVAVGTFYLTYDPQRPPQGGGGLGWALRVP